MEEASSGSGSLKKKKISKERFETDLEVARMVEVVPSNTQARFFI